MTLRTLKAGYFALEALNSFATTYFFYYFYFFMARVHGFGDRENLCLAALNGFVYMLGAWWGGRIGERLGYFRTLSLGFGIMSLSLWLALFMEAWTGHVGMMVLCTLGMCLTWPTLQALVSEKENPYGLQRMVGIYNLVWAAMGSCAFFAGGLLLETFGLRSLFWIPAAMHLGKLGLLVFLKKARDRGFDSALPSSSSPALTRLNPRPIAKAKGFLKMAWFANPFAYVAINTVVAVIPGIARRFELTPMLAGFFCSIWFFARLGTFLVLWLWSGWHYRFRFLLWSFVLLGLGFGVILMSSNLLWIIVAQAAFGIGLGHIYYSSLYYSMDVGEAKAEHGGFHEAAIGTGIFGGPAVAASAMFMFPEKPESGALAVSGILFLGLAGLVYLYWISSRTAKRVSCE